MILRLLVVPVVIVVLLYVAGRVLDAADRFEADL